MADLSAIGAKTSGTMEELTKRLAMYKRTPGLFDAMSMAKKKSFREREYLEENFRSMNCLTVVLNGKVNHTPLFL